MMTDWIGTATLAPITGQSTPSSSEPSTSVLLDHSRHFRVPPKRTPAVSVSAPYLRTLLSKFGDEAAIVGAVRDLATDAGLRVRIGCDQDNVYRLDEPVLPLVWWNPSRVELEVVEIRALVESWNASHRGAE